MSDNNKSYRIKADINNDKVLHVNLNQDFNLLNVLSLDVKTENFYKFQTSDYGCVAGRVLANGNFGIPNAKISIFIAIDNVDSEDDILSYLYPYKSVRSKNDKKVRYNLLPEEQLSDCHRNVGSFPSKRMVLDDNNVLEVYDKYYKFTTRTNEAGDYMIFGVPTGNQTLHVDIDLSDIGILSQRPRDMIYKGYSKTQFENSSMFKKSNELDGLAQIITENQSIYVYPFWGDDSETDIAITRQDINVQYEFTPTCVFMGSLITDERSNGISKRCIPSERMGKMDNLTTGKGSIEMIRKTQDGRIEEFVVQGNQLIDGNGVWCYQIPMNLDYVRTDEYGNIVPTDDPTKGIPTRAQVRFRFSLTEFENEAGYSHISKILVPNNPDFYSNEKKEDAIEAGKADEDSSVLDYAFGSDTDDNSFKDLFWNDVYTVKSFIPRIQMLNLERNKRFSGIKAVNVNDGRNPIPYNNMRVDLTFMFTLQCAVFKVTLWMVKSLNILLSALARWTFKCFTRRINIAEDLFNLGGRCVYIGEGYCPQLEGWYFAPGCNHSELMKKTYNYIRSGADEDPQSIDAQNKDLKGDSGGRQCLTNKIDYFVQCTELNLAMTYDVIQFDFYNDWINGMLYMPRWFADVRKKRKFLFGIINIEPRINGCIENAYRNIFARRYVQQCSLAYSLPDEDSRNFTKIVTKKGCSSDTKQKCHKAKGRQFRKILKGTLPGGGLVHNEKTYDDKTVYYFRPCEWVNNNNKFGTKCNLFATDIVLLGSLEENNQQGIPQTFTKLVSSSYQMPDAIVSTNEGVDGALYGNSNGTICRGTTEEAPQKLEVETDFNSIINWTAGKDVYERDPYDEKEYPVTESAGIDWGYSGPRQGKNDIKTLYFPGGHFLGISCMNSQTNIKSCVNLSRICELGTMPSSRKVVISKNGDNNFTYSYLIPTGLIAGDDINDYGFKNEFATLNYNGLKTKKNENTAMMEYDFETIFPINFDGSLSEYTQGAPYNKTNPIIEDYETKAYIRTVEENSEDYYKFRFGLHGDYTAEDAKNKYVNSLNGVVSLPVYENSFYFYFGLKNGDTALDRFYEEFFASCPALKDYVAKVTVTTENSEFCEDTGKIFIKTKNIEEPKFRVFIDGELFTSQENPDGVFVMETLNAELEGLEGDRNYTIEVYGNNITTISKSVNVVRSYPALFDEITYKFENYTAEYDELIIGTNGIGTVTFDDNFFSADTKIVAVAITSDGVKDENKKPYAAIIYNSLSDSTYSKSVIESNYSQNGWSGSTSNVNGSFSLTNASGDSVSVTDGHIRLWAGNEDYSITIYYHCDNGKISNKVISEFFVSMPQELDVVFGDYKYASYRYLVKPALEEYINDASTFNTILERWYDIILAPNSVPSVGSTVYNFIANTDAFRSHPERLENAKYYLKKAIFYQDSHCSSDGVGTIDYEINYGATPYNIKLSGCGEKTVQYTDDEYLNVKSFSNATLASDDGYDLSTEVFYSPTVDAPDYRFKSYYNDYTQTTGKTDYLLNVVDAEGEEIPLKDKNGNSGKLAIPSIYRPFFFRALYVTSGNNTTLEVAVVNGVNEKDTTKQDNYQFKEIAHIKSTDGNPAKEILNPYAAIKSCDNWRLTSVFGEGGYGGKITEQEGIVKEALDRNFPVKYYKYRFPSTVMLNGTYGVSITESGELGETISEVVQAKFVERHKGFASYDPKVTYFLLSNRSKETRTRQDGFVNLTAVDWLSANTRCFVSYTNPSIHSISNGYVWSPLISAYFKDVYTIDVIDVSKYLNEDTISASRADERYFLKPVVDKADRIYKNHPKYVVGVYDIGYQNDTENVVKVIQSLVKKKNISVKESYPMAIKHRNELAVLRIYSAVEFNSIIDEIRDEIKNGGLEED